MTDELDNEIENEFQHEDALAYETDESSYYNERGISPDLALKEDLYGLFWKVVKAKDTTKVGNLNKDELGFTKFSVRACKEIAECAHVMGKLGVRDYFNWKAEMILSTSLSRDGELLKTIVTQRRESTKQKKEVALPKEIREQQQKAFMK